MYRVLHQHILLSAACAGSSATALTSGRSGRSRCRQSAHPCACVIGSCLHACCDCAPPWRDCEAVRKAPAHFPRLDQSAPPGGCVGCALRSRTALEGCPHADRYWLYPALGIFCMPGANTLMTAHLTARQCFSAAMVHREAVLRMLLHLCSGCVPCALGRLCRLSRACNLCW